MSPISCNSQSMATAFLVLISVVGVESALIQRGGMSTFLTRKVQRLKIKVNASKHIGEDNYHRFAPHYIDERQHYAEIQEGGPKTGYWMVGCVLDKNPDHNRQTFKPKVKGVDQVTPQGCFDFCKARWGMRFFFLKGGNQCECGRFYHKGAMKTLEACSVQCEGDPSQFCGGMEFETVYQMHDCKAAMYKPKNPFEHLVFRAELYEKRAEFYVGNEVVIPPEPLEPDAGAGDNLGHALNVAVFSSKSGFVREALHFNIDGWNYNKKERETAVAVEEGERFKQFMATGIRYNSAVMIALKPTSRLGNYGWSADIEDGLRSLGCPLTHKPEDGEGYVCIGAAHQYTPQSEAFPEGHVAAYGSMLAIEDYLFYEMDCEVSEWYDKGDCSITCGHGQQLQVRHVTQEPANGGEPCPPDFERTLPCNEWFCPIDCEYSEFSGFGECDAPCGPGKNHAYRSVTVFMEHGGVPCEEPLEKTKDCQVVPCPIDCEYAEWQEWSVCSEYCGEGMTTRHRDHGVEAKYGGLPCNGPADEETVCLIKPCPVKCIVSEWENSGECSKTCATGQQLQTRKILQQALHGAEECPTDMEQHLPCNEFSCPQDCEMSEWEEDGFCSHTCGGGEVMVRRYIMRQPAFGGMACPTTLEKMNDCNTQACPVDCIIAPWTGWSTCSKTCGEGVQTRTRFEEVVALYGGRKCPAKKKMERFCEVLPCKIDAKWGDWSNWGDCTQECGPGVQRRTRKIAVHAMFGGVPAEGPKEEEQACEVKPCPVECKLSDWRDEGGCDKVCGGGLQTQVRDILTDAAHGAAACPGPEGLIQKVDCNTYPCPVDCVMTAWEDDGTCSLSCGGGIMEQIRTVMTQPQYGGKPCPTRLEREVPCATEYCPIDCIWNGWTGWSACSEFCGEGLQSRMRNKVVLEEHGGAGCEGPAAEERDCIVRPCPIDGKWSPWSQWGECDQACGPGSQARSRTIEVQPQFGGKPLEGPEQESKDCNKGPCPITCEITDWMMEGVCSMSCGGGLQKWKRTILVDAQHGAEACPSTLEKDEPCNTNGCPVDCVLTDWVEDGDCSVSCGGGQRMERKNVDVAPSNGGKACPTQLQRAVPCNEPMCPIDCVWGPWSGWNMCDEVCGPGLQHGVRHHAVIAEFGGKACEGPDKRERTCELVPCPIDCAWSEWTDWSACDEFCGPGFQEKSRYRETHAQYGGKPCEGPNYQEQPCKLKDCPVDCEVTPWMITGECTKLCGGGTERETREIKVDAAAGGAECPSELFRDMPCNTQPCAVDCVVSGWVNDGTCSQSCGGGMMHQVKNILVAPDHGGKDCPPAMERYEKCEEQACPVDCIWGPWTGWSPCNAACGEGVQTRSRSIYISPDFGGLECEGPYDEEQGCKLTDCPVDGEWTDWSAWGACDEACGTGWHTRTRSLAVEAQFGGKPAEGPSYEMQECFDKPCPVDCVVSHWEKEGECSKSCNGGDQKEIRTIKQAAAHGGIECPTDLERFVVCNEDPCPVNCMLSQWGKDGECSVTCGGGEIMEVRKVIVPTENGGRGCDAPFSRQAECGTAECPVDCVWGQWGGWSACSVTCGEGETKRARNVVSDALHGGLECEGPGEESEVCGDPCPIHCEWGEWTEFSACSEECGPGVKARTREEAVRAQYGGKTCEGAAEESEDCNEKECAIDCDITDWIKVSDCSVSCGGGLYDEERTINQEALFGGEECPPNLYRQMPCNEDPCPVDCVMSDWEQVNGCSVTCGGGLYTEEKVCLTQMNHGGVECPAEDTWTKEVECNLHDCPIDCQFGQWTGWGQCSTTCGGGVTKREREIAVEADHGGASCEGTLEEEQPCNAFFCPIHCEWAEWSEWGECSEDCGPGISERTRSVAVSAAYGGSQCQGVPHEEKDCQVQYCPVDCVMSDWMSVGICSTSCGLGKRAQTRTVTVKDDHGGVVCPESLQREVDCSATPCPVDCVLTDWFDEGDCSLTCGGGKQKNIRTVDVPTEHGGKACDPYQERMLDCNMHACPIDCEVSQWSDWGDCSVSCNDGQKHRTRGITIHPEHGGVACPDSFKETTSCKPIDCPIDCVLAQWNDWGACTQECGPGLQTRTRGIQVQAKFGGAVCEGAREEQIACNIKPCPVDCEVTAWEMEGDCDLSCGGGQQKQIRKISQAALHGGKECPGLSQYIECNTQECPVDCKLTDWAMVGECSHSCGTGLQEFDREVQIGVAFGGKPCEEGRQKTEECNTHECPVDCEWGDWQAWGACTHTCGGGTKTAEKPIAVEKAHGGKSCEGSATKETSCNPMPCPVDCEVAEWGAWGDCSVTCGEGTQNRKRTVSQSALHGGRVCPVLSETQSCKPLDCPVHCEITLNWEPAGQCSKTCGTGEIHKTRNILVEPQHGGNACPQTSKYFPCNDHECPIDCAMSDWADDGTCSEQCGGGLQKKRRFVETQNAFGGIQCPDEIERDDECNTHLCPVMPIGEQGIGEFAIEGAALLQGSMATTATSAWISYSLNGNYVYPAVFAGVPTADAVVQLSGIRKVGVQEHVPACPLHLTTPMPQGNLLSLTIKKGKNDFCTGVAGQNECHDEDSDGGEPIGFIFKEPLLGREDQFVEIRRYVYDDQNDKLDDTCTGLEGTMHGEMMIDGMMTPTTDCWGQPDLVPFSQSLGFVYKKDVLPADRPGTVPLVKVTVTTLCGNVKQFLYQANVLDGSRAETKLDATAAQHLTVAKEMLTKTLGFPEASLKEMSEYEVLDVLLKNEISFGVECEMRDTCTGLEGQTQCHLPPGEAKEELVGYVVGADPDTEDPADNWGNCASVLVCPVPYTEPVPALLIEVARKEVPEGENGVVKCAGQLGQLPCGDDEEPMGGDSLGFLFEDILLGLDMVPVTEGMLFDPVNDTKKKEIGFAFKEKQQGTHKVGSVWLVTEGFKEMYATCGFFSDQQKKWNFQMKIEFKPDKVEDPSVKASFMVYASGVYETHDIDDEQKKYVFQVGTAKIAGGDKETEIEFHEEFKEPPMVISSVQSYNTGKMVQTRHKVVPNDGKSFLVKLETLDGPAEDEWIAWLAMEPGHGKIGSMVYKAVQTGNDVGDGGEEIDFSEENMPSKPSVFGSISTDHGTEPAHLAVVESEISNTKLKVGAKNNNFEGGHANEKAALLILESQSMQAAVMKGWLTRKVHYTWLAGDFGECSTVCGEGKKTRPVECKSSLHLKTVQDYYCHGEKPAPEEKCGAVCTWAKSDWSECPGTGEDKKKTRTVHCQLGQTDEVPDGECSELGDKPATETDCCNPKTTADFPDLQCGTKPNGCSAVNAGDVDFGTCGSDWVCESNKCTCHENDVAVTGQPVTTDFLNKFMAPIAYQCGEGQVLTGVASEHNDPAEDRKFQFTCTTLAAPAAVGPVCEAVSFCGGKADGEAQCPAGFVLTGLNAAVPVDEDRVYDLKCCELLGVETGAAEEGSGDMSKEQEPFNFAVTGGKMLTGMKTEWNSDKVDRKFQFFWKSFKTKKHCQTCTVGDIGINITGVAFPADPAGRFRKDFDFSCPEGEVLQGVESAYQGPREDSEWKLKCAPLTGSKVANGGDAAPNKCGAALEGGFTLPRTSWYLECPRNEMITKVSSKYDETEGDRTYQFKCGKLDDGAKLRLKGDIKSFPKDGEAKWSYKAGQDTAITAVESSYSPGGQRTFKFYGSTFNGPEKCEEVWIRGV